MKQEKYEKALEKHEEKLNNYSMSIHDIVDMMLEDNCSVADVFGVLETEKLFRFQQSCDLAKVDSFMKMFLGDEEE